MDIIEKISLWGGVAGVVTAVFAIIIIYLTRSNIVDLLDRDIIMYDKVYELKKNAFQNAFDVLDYYELYGMEVRSSKQFIQKAKSAYNDLVCTTNSPKVFEEFYKLTLDQSYTRITVQELANFKTACRNDLGLHIRKNKKVKVDTSAVVSQLQSTSPSQNIGGGLGGINGGAANPRPTSVQPGQSQPTPRPAAPRPAPRPVVRPQQKPPQDGTPAQK